MHYFRKILCLLLALCTVLGCAPVGQASQTTNALEALVADTGAAIPQAVDLVGSDVPGVIPTEAVEETAPPEETLEPAVTEDPGTPEGAAAGTQEDAQALPDGDGAQDPNAPPPEPDLMETDPFAADSPDPDRQPEIPGDTGTAADNTCGEALTWAYEETSKTLTISGTGLMADYTSAKNTPWYAHMAAVETVVVSEGVTGIGNYAFCGAAALTSVSLPGTLVSMGTYSFSKCAALTAIAVPEGVTVLKDSVFSYCSALTQVTLPSTLTALEKFAFYQCTSLPEIQLPDSITSLGYRCFYGCTALAKVNIPRNWTEAASSNGSTMSTSYCGRIFEGCTSLTSLEIPDGVTVPAYGLCYSDYVQTITYLGSTAEINNHSFYGCARLESIVIPSGVAVIEKSAFYGCSALASVTIPETVTELEQYAFSECKALTAVQLPDAIAKIGFKAFAKCTSLASINLPKGWTEATSSNGTTMSTSYCGRIFEGCTSLTALEIPDGLTIPAYGLCYSDYVKTITYLGSTAEINNQSFYGCKRLESIHIPSGVTVIEKSAFYQCNALKDITLPDTVTELAHYAFYECKALEKITLPDGITKIGFQCFYKCTSLASINLPKSWTEATSSSSSGTMSTSYCGRIFEGCTSLTSLEIPDGVTVPAYGLCYSDYVQTITYLGSTAEINNQSFYGCKRLESINIPSGVTVIEKSAFCQCNALKDITLPDTVTELELYAFYECKALTAVTLPDSIEKIGYQCFYKCTSLSSINLPKNWKEAPSSYSSGTISASYCGHIFEGCTSLTALEVPEGLTIPAYGLCYSSGLQTVTYLGSTERVNIGTFYGCSALETVTIPSGAVAVERDAFNNCKALVNVTLPDTVTELETNAFYYCSSLKKLVLPDAITHIGYRCFYKCTSLESINIPKSWSEIPSADSSGYQGYIFEGCTSLTALEIPDGVTVPAYGLQGSNKLQTVTYLGSSTEIQDYSFYGCKALETVKFPEKLTRIGSFAFYDCEGLTEVELPDTVADLGYSAFGECANLEQINIPKGWTTCSSRSADGAVSLNDCGNIFQGCTRLLAVAVPEGMKTLPTYAFKGCSSLKKVVLPKSLTEIPAYAFYGCSGLISISVPEGVTVIREQAFYGCSSASTILLPESVTTVEKKAFSGCGAVQNVSYRGSQEAWKNVSVDTGNTPLTSSNYTVNYDFRVTFKPEDFLFVWEGEYDGNYNYTTIVQRHFVATFDSCDAAGNLSGTVTFSPSHEITSAYSANGSYFLSGVVDLDTGAIFFQGHTWIEYPTGHSNFNFLSFDGTLSADKAELNGINGKDTTRTFYAKKLGASETSKTEVTMSSDGKIYNLLTDPVSFVQNSDDLATISVVPDWQGHTPGTVRLFQMGTAVESKTGVFVDMVPSKLFSPLESIYYALVDSESNVVETRKLKLRIEVDTATRLQPQIQEIALRVYENKKDSGSQSDKYVLSEGAIVTVDGTAYTTDKDGNVKIPVTDLSAITVSKAGFVTRTISAAQLEISQDVHLQKTGDGKPVVNAVLVGTVDVLNKEMPIELLSKESLTFKAEVDWGTSSYGSIQLVQDGRSVKFTKDSLTTVLSSNFDVSKPVYIQATDKDGNSTKKKLKFSPGEASAIPSSLQGLKFSTGDSFSVTLPKNMKPEFLAGWEISADISSLIPVTLSVEDGKVYVAIGVELASYEYAKDSYTNSNTGNKFSGKTKNEVKTFAQKFKDSGVLDTDDAKKALKNLKEIQNTYKRNIRYPKGTFGVEANVTLLGFAEGYVDADGNVDWLDGGVILNPKVSLNRSFPFSIPTPIGPIPMFFETGFGADVLGQLNILYDKAVKTFTPNGQISGTISVYGGLMAGMKKVLYAGGGLKGNLKPDWRIYLSQPDSFKLTASLNAYAKLGIAFFEIKKDFDPIAEAVWVDLPKHKTALATPGSGVYDSGSYQRKNLSYLDGGSQFTANQITVPLLMTQRANAAYLTSTTIQTNLYRESTPQYVRFADGTALALWLDAQSSNVNEIQLYYAYHNGSSWSAPAPVQADGTMDYTPKLKLIGNTAYLVWQNATQTFSDGDTLDSIAPYFDISVAQFDPASGFTASTLTKEGLDMIPTLCGDGTKTYAVWVNNSQNAWFGGNQANHIFYSENTGTGWSEPVSAYTDLKAIDSLAADYSEGTLRIAYCMDTDGNVSTAEDVRLFENGARVSDAGSAEANPQYLDHVLHWYHDSKIRSADGTVQETEGLNGSYQILTSDAGSAVVYASSNGLASTLNASFYNSDTMQWCEPFALTDGTEFIGAFCAAMDDDGSIRVLCNAQKVTGTYTDEDPYGEAALKLISSAPYCDLTMGALSYSLDQYSAGNAMELSFPLTNNGSLVVNSILVTVADGSGSTLSSLTLDDVIVPGQTRDLSTYFNVPENAAGQTVTVTVMPNGMSDIRTADNYQSASLQFEDVGIQRTTLGFREDETPVVTADIVNYGYHSKSNITVELRKDTADGTLIASKTISSLEPLALESVSFALTGQREGVYYVVISGSGDSFAGNDTDFVAWGTVEEDEEENQASVVRIAGKDRHETAFKIADMLKTQLGVEKFDTMIIASGADSADALAGSYLAARKRAPILLSRGSSHARNLEYIQANLAPGGKVYILGGTAAVPQEMENLLKDNNIQYERLKGKTRFDTNLAILDEAGMDGSEILVSTGYNFADSLSASASGKPILLVHTNANVLTDSQKTWLSTQRGKTFTIIGGTGAVSEKLETELQAYGTTTRLKGSGREATSVEVAKKFFTAPDAALLAYSRNFPDGLCGGPLAYAMKAPLLLVNAGKEADAQSYVSQNAIAKGYILGGTGVVGDDTARTVFQLDSSTEIPKQ